MSTSCDENLLLKAAFDAAAIGLLLAGIPNGDRSRPAQFPLVLMNRTATVWTGNQANGQSNLSHLLQWLEEPGVEQMLSAVVEKRLPDITIESRFMAPGAPQWVRVSAKTENAFLVISLEDITPQKKVEVALLQSEKQQRLYDSITQNTPDLVYVFDLNYLFTYANKALLSMWGKSAEDAIGKGLRDNGYEEWHALMHEREIDTVVATRQRLRGTVSFPHAELGKRIYDYIFAPVFNENGEVEFVAGTTRDITDFKLTEENLQQSEARLKSVIDQTPAPTLVLRGDELIIEQINYPMLELIGQGEEIIGRPLIQVLPELEGQYVWNQVRKVYIEGIPFNQSEVLVPHTRNGVMQDHYYNLAYRPRKENNQITGMIQVAIDVTEQVVARKIKEESEYRYRLLSETLEQLVSERTRELRRSNDDLQQFAHVASHDLKEPVRKIKTFTERLEQHLSGQLDASAARFLEKIHMATKRMFTMIDGVLTYSTTNAEEQNVEQVDLDKLIADIKTDLEVTLQQTGGHIHHGPLPVLEGATVLLYQLFYNLINNSIKFVDPGTSPEIYIGWDNAIDAGDNFCMITLRDNGIGFEPEFAEHIFETFTRLNSKDSYEGTGLGLALCKKIVERHGGSITASSEPGKGAVFSMVLPRTQNQSSI